MLHPILRFLRVYRRLIVAAAIGGAAVALIFSIVQPLCYRATMRLLLIQATSPTLDAFTAVKSAEKVGKNLGQIIASSSFLERVLQANPNVDGAAFPSDERKRRKRWEKMVETSVATETSVMEIRVYHPQRGQALAVADAIGTVLVRDAREYTGSRDIVAKVIDSPLASRLPVRPNILLNIIIGCLLGAFLGAAWVYIRRPIRSE
ncbi:MAG: hypothetical protein V1723_03325 [Candidatus Uhrbacteria bacterium]